MAGLALVIPAAASASESSGPGTRAEIFFANGGRILSMRADGTGYRVLTRPRATADLMSRVADGGPVPSPDGQTVLFSRRDDGSSTGAVLSIDREGGSLKTIFSERESRSSLVSHSIVDWFPDGSRFYFLRFHATENASGVLKVRTTLGSVDPDGGAFRSHYRTSVRYTDQGAQGDPWFATDASVSPDGSFAVLGMTKMFPGAGSRIARVDLATGQRKWLSNDGGSPRISPDGSRVVFTSERDRMHETCSDGYCEYDPKLYVMNIDGSDVRSLLRQVGGGSYHSPDWSPDGTRIVFSSNRGTGFNWFGSELWSVMSDGSCLTRLTNGSPASQQPAWGAGSILGPAVCGEARLRTYVDVLPPERSEKLKPRPMWLGHKWSGLLAVGTSIGGRTLGSHYLDCGFLDASRCFQGLSVYSGPVCNRLLGDTLTYSGYAGMEKLRGGIVLQFDGRGSGRSVRLLTGGADIGIEVSPTSEGRPISRGRLLGAVDQLRYVGHYSPPARFVVPTFAAGVVRKARRMLRYFEKSGSLRQAAAEAGLFQSGKGRFQVSSPYRREAAKDWVRFARDLNSLARYKTIKCEKDRNK